MANPQVIGNKVNPWAWLNNLSDKNCGIFTNAGVPTNGTSGTFAGKAGIGCMLIDVTNGVLYINQGTKASPTWNANSIVTPSEISLAVINKTGSDITTDKLVSISGLDTTSGLPKIVLADADVAASDDVYVTTATIANNATGLVYKGATSAANLNTNSVSSAGDPVYLSTTAGAFTVTAPTTAISKVIPVGFVLVKSATVGQILWVVSPARKIGTNELQDSLTLATPILTTPTLNTPIFSEYKVLAANATYSATVTPATLTGFSWTVVAGTYIFELNLPTTMTTVGGLTINFALTTAVLTSIQYQSYAATATDNADAVSTNGTTTTSGTKVFDSKTAAYTHINIKGSMVVGTGGTFAWQGCQNTSAGAGDATVVAIGSFAKMERVA